MSFNNALSGINAAQKDLNVTANNIANVNTTGFKESRAEFADVYANSIFVNAKTQVGNGVATGAVAQQFHQGALQFTNNALDLAIKGEGFFVTPTIFANPGRDLSIVREEIFGPVLVVNRIDDLGEIVASANDTRYGLGAGVFTRDLDRAHALAARLQAGNVWVNCYGITHPTMPFGGYKESGWGREMGDEGLDAFLETKSVFMNQPPGTGTPTAWPFGSGMAGTSWSSCQTRGAWYVAMSAGIRVWFPAMT